ncbi:ATP-dependent DNA helicase PIF1 [Merluccius polli]|uniref:ATP-dependent DNA helicase PIF1 n=1 Tax=Merluccius polli TaxID=89951 RepID=A0AA47ME47_MERPO|nr:ATP-dependent DNA helicase PIF1 [Merluccius polli]
MVDHKLLAYIHGHLRQIKQPGNYSPFGNVSVIAVEDFYQLPPVKGKPLYLDDDSVGLWTQFQIVELKTIVRQKDVVFAELLNRVRCRSKGSPMLDSDIQLLKHCETGEDSSDLHIFPTNKQVRCHDIQQLFKSCPEYVQIEAKDFVTSKTTGKLVLKEGHHTKTYNTSLDQTLVLGVGACVMLLKNLDVDDGLVNGVCGTVTHVVYPDNDDKFPKMIFVKFDDDQVGTKMRSCSAFVAAVEMGSTGIEPEEERYAVMDASVTREELYPLVLGATGEALEALIRETRRCTAAKRSADMVGRQSAAAQAREAGLVATADRLQDQIDSLQLDILDKDGMFVRLGTCVVVIYCEQEVRGK